jgi:hypothetical protein
VRLRAVVLGLVIRSGSISSSCSGPSWASDTSVSRLFDMLLLLLLWRVQTTWSALGHAAKFQPLQQIQYTL